jgi:hypothetical protein
MERRKLTAMACVCLLGACSAEYMSHDETPKEQALAQCQEYGFQAGTDAMAECVERRIEARNAAMANLWRGASEEWNKAANSWRSTTCTNYGMVTTCR